MFCRPGVLVDASIVGRAGVRLSQDDKWREPYASLKRSLIRRLVSGGIVSAVTWAMRHASLHLLMAWNLIHIGAGLVANRLSSSIGQPLVLRSLLRKKSWYCAPRGSNQSATVLSLTISADSRRAVVDRGPALRAARFVGEIAGLTFCWGVCRLQPRLVPVVS
jgi:hypothetical protein